MLSDGTEGLALSSKPHLFPHKLCDQMPQCLLQLILLVISEYATLANLRVLFEISQSFCSGAVICFGFLV